MYATLLVVLSITYLSHYCAHGYDWVEMSSYMAAVVVIITLAIKDRRANK